MPRFEVKITVKANGQRVGKQVVKRDVNGAASADQLQQMTHTAVDKLASDLRAEVAV